MGDCSDPADHLVWERWQFIDLRIQGGMFVRSSGEGAAKMHVSRFDVLVTLAYVTSTVLWVVVPVGWPKTSTPPCHRPPRIERRDGAHGRTRTAGLLLTKNALFANRQPLRGWWRARQARRPDRATVRSPSNCVGASIIRGSRLVGAIPVEPQLRFSVGGILVWLAISCLRSASICSTVGT